MEDYGMAVQEIAILQAEVKRLEQELKEAQDSLQHRNNSLAEYSLAWNLEKESLKAQVQQLQEQVSRLREALKAMVDDDDCSLDHHGYCQTHGWLSEGVCPQFTAKMLLQVKEKQSS